MFIYIRRTVSNVPREPFPGGTLAVLVVAVAVVLAIAEALF